MKMKSTYTTKLSRNWKILFVLVINVAISFNSFSQQTNIWYFGDHAGIDFNGGSPVAVTNGSLDTYEGCASICNSTGALLFYTDGVTVYDASHNVMQYGNGLFGNSSSTQSALVIPFPGNPNNYYIFTTGYCGGW